MQRAHNVHDITPEASFIAEWRFFLVDAAINTSTQMFNKSTVNFSVNAANFSVKVNLDLGHKYSPYLLRIGWS